MVNEDLFEAIRDFIEKTEQEEAFLTQVIAKLKKVAQENSLELNDHPSYVKQLTKKLVKENRFIARFHNQIKELAEEGAPSDLEKYKDFGKDIPALLKKRTRLLKEFQKSLVEAKELLPKEIRIPSETFLPEGFFDELKSDLEKPKEIEKAESEKAIELGEDLLKLTRVPIDLKSPRAVLEVYIFFKDTKAAYIDTCKKLIDIKGEELDKEAVAYLEKVTLNAFKRLRKMQVAIETEFGDLEKIKSEIKEREDEYFELADALPAQLAARYRYLIDAINAIVKGVKKTDISTIGLTAEIRRINILRRNLKLIVPILKRVREELKPSVEQKLLEKAPQTIAAKKLARELIEQTKYLLFKEIDPEEIISIFEKLRSSRDLNATLYKKLLDALEEEISKKALEDVHKSIDVRLKLFTAIHGRLEEFLKKPDVVNQIVKLTPAKEREYVEASEQIPILLRLHYSHLLDIEKELEPKGFILRKQIEEEKLTKQLRTRLGELSKLFEKPIIELEKLHSEHKEFEKKLADVQLKLKKEYENLKTQAEASEIPEERILGALRAEFARELKKEEDSKELVKIFKRIQNKLKEEYLLELKNLISVVNSYNGAVTTFLRDKKIHGRVGPAFHNVQTLANKIVITGRKTIANPHTGFFPMPMLSTVYAPYFIH